MIYVMSDLHGEFDKFMQMLKLINFSSKDTLYILGDVLDRGESSIKIIDYIRKKENQNIHLIIGNHELLFVMYYLDNAYLDNWVSAGGFSTYRELQKKEEGYEKELYEYLLKSPTYKIIDKYILVHAGLYLPDNCEKLLVEELMSMQTQDSLLWDRSFVESNKYFKDFTVVCGHTPTINYMEEGKEARILYSQGKIMIDCGAHFTEFKGRLACLRLDDLEEFYV